MASLPPLDGDRIIHWKWQYRAHPEEALRAVAARRLDLSPEAASALDAVLAERGIVVRAGRQPRAYRGFTGFLRRHWRGDYGLARSYWVHTLLFSTLASTAVVSALRSLDGVKARHSSLAVLLGVAFMTAVWVWGVVGAWAAAGKHAARGGNGFWAGMAMVAIVLGVLRNAGEMATFAPSMVEHLRVALGEQPGEAVEFVVQADGRSLLLRGGINDDTAEGLERALQRAPGVRTLVLESAGGWVGQGRALAAVITRHHLATYVESECTSACTIAFLAGHDRAADPAARLGFHAFRRVGARAGGRARDGDGDEQMVYGAAGLGRAFIGRVQATPPEAVWYPEHAVLLREGVLTRSSAGGETAGLSTRLRSRDEAVRVLLKGPVHEALRTHFPERHAAVADAAWNALQQRRVDRDVVGALRAALADATAGLLAGADDATLEAYLLLLADQAAALREDAPEACVRLLFAAGAGDDIRQRLPRRLLLREQEVLRDIIATSAPAHRRVFVAPQVDAMLHRVLAKLPPRDVRAITGLRSGAAAPAATCSAGIRLVEAVLALPPPERGLHARALFAS